MKKIYLFVIVACFAANLSAQRTVNDSPFTKKFIFGHEAVDNMNKVEVDEDTLISHFVGSTPNLYGIQPCVPNGPGGWMTGHNCWLDKAKMQKFEWIAPGNAVIAVLPWFALKSANPNNIVKIHIWEDDNGIPGNILGTSTLTYNDIDTNIATSTFGTRAIFNPPVDVPSSGIIWAGVELDYSAGDVLAIVTTTNGDYLSAETHTMEIRSDDKVIDFKNGWNSEIALGMFPIIAPSTATRIDRYTSNTVKLLQNHPNPFNKQTTINYELVKEGNVQMEVYDITGKKMLTFNKGMQNAGKHHFVVNGNDLSNGLYFYKLNVDEVTLTNKMTVVH